MTDDGKNLLSAVRTVRHFFGEVAGLLATADAMMGEAGWERRAANTAVADTSASLQVPERWMPYMAFRLYRFKDAQHLMPSIAVIFESDTDPVLLVEPLVVASVFDFGIGEKVSDSYYSYSHAGFYARLQERTDNGQIIEIDPRQVFPSARCVAKRMVAFGRPLVTIGSSTLLKEHVVAPLLKLLETRAK